MKVYSRDKVQYFPSSPTGIKHSATYKQHARHPCSAVSSVHCSAVWSHITIREERGRETERTSCPCQQTYTTSTNVPFPPRPTLSPRKYLICFVWGGTINNLLVRILLLGIHLWGGSMLKDRKLIWHQHGDCKALALASLKLDISYLLMSHLLVSEYEIWPVVIDHSGCIYE